MRSRRFLLGFFAGAVSLALGNRWFRSSVSIVVSRGMEQIDVQDADVSNGAGLQKQLAVTREKLQQRGERIDALAAEILTLKQERAALRERAKEDGKKHHELVLALREQHEVLAVE